ncbi:sel1 repeat family protein [Mesorhizobium sp. M2E.F.Ca.ET.219.01.1.1]|uniref:sel1 repeat family protein n=1 Tax=Mesorhizobium sp. M2E.F.Ca.ET.219.01.1.1 TaxID=2500530 RepID=UPI000FDBA122|nr:sel1 repeat family protein [Mesorhizobium sp. M2E.F.Ca.ET.219.01.1.1]TGQ17076.1 sel1 repeat family protein [Mesorhizobium sp. M2E.F.Ca.ET.219.01.1.1]TGW02940.1 sel1 repeat family protein [Mesorhizobium sp. M2E.F.Ca.ET.154.01.1.1]
MTQGAAILAAIVAVVATATAALGDEPTFDPRVMSKLLREVGRRGTPNAYFQRCPADIWRKSVPRSNVVLPEMNYDRCERDALACARLCFEGRNPEACFETARVIQENGGEDQQLKAEAMFAQACATGSAAGCTNRGAGMRLGRLPDSLLGNEKAANHCTYETFKLSCSEGDAWGCTMYGAALQNGEGVAKDKDAATTAFKKACEIDASFVACQYAKSYMESGH